MEEKKRIAVYIDGFNLYHAVKNLKQPHLKWLNLRSLAEKFINRQREVVEKIYYFSAIATHLDSDIANRHRAYIEALQSVNVDFIAGNFKKKPLFYKNRHIEVKWNKHEEKETDVNIAITIVHDALLREYDKFFLISNDTDIVPAIKMARAGNEDLEFKLLTPPTYHPHDSLRDAIRPGKHVKLTSEQLGHSLLPLQITKPNGKIIHMPESYRK